MCIYLYLYADRDRSETRDPLPLPLHFNVGLGVLWLYEHIYKHSNIEPGGRGGRRYSVRYSVYTVFSGSEVGPKYFR